MQELNRDLQKGIMATMLVAAALVLGACSSDDDFVQPEPVLPETPTTPDEPKKDDGQPGDDVEILGPVISAGGSLGPQSRAPQNSNENTDYLRSVYDCPRLGMFATNAGETSIYGEAENVKYQWHYSIDEWDEETHTKKTVDKHVLLPDETISDDDKPRYPSDNSEVDLYFYYPHQEGFQLTDGAGNAKQNLFRVQPNQAHDNFEAGHDATTSYGDPPEMTEGYRYSDLCWGKLTSAAADKDNLVQMRHLLPRLLVQLEFSDGFSRFEQLRHVNITNVLMQGYVNLLTGEVTTDTSDESKGTIEAFVVTPNLLSGYIYLMPQTIPAGTEIAEIVEGIDGTVRKSRHLDLDEDFKLEAGGTYVLTISLWGIEGELNAGIKSFKEVDPKSIIIE